MRIFAVRAVTNTLLSLLLATSVLASAGVVSAQEPIKIGTIFPFTGANAVFGNQNFQGVDIAADMVNERGGVRGRKILLIKGDAPSPAAAISETNRLITREGLRILLGSTSSAIAIPATQEAEKNKVIYWEGMAVANDVTTRGF